MAPASASGLVDLPALRTAASPVIAWYEAFLAGRPTALADLDMALRGLRALPPIGGRLGRAVALVAAGGRQATTEETIAALERLRASAGLRATVPATPTETQQTPPAAKGRRRRTDWTQPPLPGMGER
ncbi:MAG: hypothetical protein ABR511_06300 [Acidimicrobiales bacterium]